MLEHTCIPFAINKNHEQQVLVNHEFIMQHSTLLTYYIFD